MTVRRKSVLFGAVALLVASGMSWAAPGGVPGPNPNAPGQIKKELKAPEIDASAGTSAIALLAGVLVAAA
jgi:hypothetical protein